MKEGLKQFQSQAKQLVKDFHIPYRVAMKSLAYAKKLGVPVDNGVIKEVSSMLSTAQEEKSKWKEIELQHGKRQKIYSEHLLQEIVDEIKGMRQDLAAHIKQLKENNHG